jgi:hypothetical protein
VASVRCAGCGELGSSVCRMNTHISTCPEYLSLWKEDRERALGPREEFLRWKEQEQSPEKIAIRRSDNIAKKFAALDARRVVADRRWAPRPDPLDD